MVFIFALVELIKPEGIVVSQFVRTINFNSLGYICTFGKHTTVIIEQSFDLIETRQFFSVVSK